jgi:hypothetical protein
MGQVRPMLRFQIVPVFLPITVQIVPFSFLPLLLSLTLLPMIVIGFQGVISLTVVSVPGGTTIAQGGNDASNPTTDQLVFCSKYQFSSWYRGKRS